MFWKPKCVGYCKCLTIALLIRQVCVLSGVITHCLICLNKRAGQTRLGVTILLVFHKIMNKLCCFSLTFQHLHSYSHHSVCFGHPICRCLHHLSKCSRSKSFSWKCKKANLIEKIDTVSMHQFQFCLQSSGLDPKPAINWNINLFLNQGGVACGEVGYARSCLLTDTAISSRGRRQLSVS